MVRSAGFEDFWLLQSQVFGLIVSDKPYKKPILQWTLYMVRPAGFED